MSILITHAGEIATAFSVTLALFAAAAVCALTLGATLAVTRSLPVGTLRRIAAGYVSVMRNTPVVLVFFFITFGLPQLGLRFSFFAYATIALALYEAAHVCESLRSGFNAIAPGQSQAARSLGMSGAMMLREILLPQAVRNAVPALGNNLISLAKATSLAGSFGVVEATAQLHRLTIEEPGAVFVVFCGIAAGYVAINLAVATVVRRFELRLAVPA
ncbi:MAG: amino acid ABC transporter permease [Rhodocyclaceae bacterium]